VLARTVDVSHNSTEFCGGLQLSRLGIDLSGRCLNSISRRLEDSQVDSFPFLWIERLGLQRLKSIESFASRFGDPSGLRATGEELFETCTVEFQLVRGCS